MQTYLVSNKPPSDLADDDLVQQAQIGDPGAFEILFYRRNKMFNINYSYGIARVHRSDSPLVGCQPEDKKSESGWWETDLTTIPPEGVMIKAGDGSSYQVDYCHYLGKGCMGNQ